VLLATFVPYDIKSLLLDGVVEVQNTSLYELGCRKILVLALGMNDKNAICNLLL